MAARQNEEGRGTAEGEVVDSPVVENQAEGSAKEKSGKPDSSEDRSWMMLVVHVVGLLFCLFVFLVGLSLMGNAFKVLGGRGASSMFQGVDNPVSGLMVGVLATVMVQSSSTSTSITV